MELKHDDSDPDVDSTEVHNNIHRSLWSPCIFTFGAPCLQLLPTKQKIFLLISRAMIFLFVIAILYGVLGNDVLPGSEVFALFLLYTLSCIGGKIVECFRLPPLFGMLMTGFMYRNLPFIAFDKDISVKWASALRFVISAVSPAVVVPSLLNLQERKYGTLKGIPTLVIAAASVDDILAITGFSIMLSISLSEGTWIWSLSKGILEPIAGFVYGLTCGYILWHIPGKDIAKLSLTCYRLVLLTCGGLAVMFSSKALDVAGAGPFGCLVLGFVAALRWKKDADIYSDIEGRVSSLWTILQPFLFSLIGYEVTVTSLEQNIGSSMLVLSAGILIRFFVALLATFRGGFNWKEKVFIAFAWIPKATVQAAIGPQALDFVLVNDKGPEMENYAKKVLAVAVLSILLTAPVGAVLIAILGPVLLNHDCGDPEEPQPVCLEEIKEETSKL